MKFNKIDLDNQNIVNTILNSLLYDFNKSVKKKDIKKIDRIFNDTIFIYNGIKSKKSGVCNKIKKSFGLVISYMEKTINGNFK